MVSGFSLSSCSTLQFTPGNVRIAAAFACGNTLQWAVSPADREEVSNQLYAVAHGMFTITGEGKVPTPEELKATIELFTPNSSKWVYLADSIAPIYAAWYPSFKGNSKAALDVIAAIAQGVTDAAARYATPAGP